VLLLHSFEYDRAASSFRDAQAIDPDFALAYWGEAMTYNHPVWNEQDLDAARVVLDRFAPTPTARRMKIRTERERAYLETMEILYGQGQKEQRDTLYAQSMERVVERYPDDFEAKAFYALALLGLSRGTRYVPTYMQAAAVAQAVFDRNPHHPGAAHYIIHAFDDPVHAPLGLKAAKAYSKIAPDAPHAQHMTTHIFLALGMWDDVVSQNTIASGPKPWGPGHYTSWLGYGYLQQGRFADALNQLEEVQRNTRHDAGAGMRAYLAEMRANYVLNTERWHSPVLDWAIDLTGIDFWGTRGRDAFVSIYSRMKLGYFVDRDAAIAALKRATGKDDRSTPILETEVRALLALQDKRLDEALQLMRTATAMEDSMPVEFGPPVVVKPSHELFGEILLQLDRPSEAQEEFERALQLTPKRALSLLGLGRAAAAALNHRTALRAYRTLQEIWHRADPDLEALAEAARYISRHGVTEGG
jgi:tetratricopeptide (TPR) repeat protein